MSQARWALRILVMLALALAVSSPAFASGPPYFETRDKFEQQLRSTRVRITAPIHNRELRTTMQAGYSEHETGPWIKTDEFIEPATPGNNQIANFRLGSESDHSGESFLRHLKPNTQYYAQFTANNSAGEAKEIFPFKTLSIMKPEIDVSESNIGAGNPASTFRIVVSSLAQRSVQLEAQIETNGAATEYRFEVSTGQGPGTVCDTGTISVAEDFGYEHASCSGLTPETTYVARVKATNERGSAEETLTFKTVSARPTAYPPTARNIVATTAHLLASIVPHGETTKWRFEVAHAEAGPWTPLAGAAGVISHHEAESLPNVTAAIVVNAQVEGLAAATTYYVRVYAESECVEYCGEGQNPLGEPIRTASSEVVSQFKTTGAPVVTTLSSHGLRSESLRLLGIVNPESALTSAEQTVTLGGSPTGGTFALGFEGHMTDAPTTGTLQAGSRTITALPLRPVEATASGTNGEKGINVHVTAGHLVVGEPIEGPGIGPNTTINRVEGSTVTIEPGLTESISNVSVRSVEPSGFVAGEVVSGPGVPAGDVITSTTDTVSTGGKLELAKPTSETASGVTLTAGIPYDAEPGVVEHGLGALPGGLSVSVEGPSGGPFTVVFDESDAGREFPKLESDGSGLTPSGSVAVTVNQLGGSGYDGSYHFQYEIESEGTLAFSHASVTPTVDLGKIVGSRSVGADLPPLQPGGTYRYRVIASSTAPGDPSSDGAEMTLRVPFAGEAPASSCVNESLRGGPSAALPDCRAYEQVTPAEKGGAEQPFHYAGLTAGYTLAGEGGEHVMLENQAVDYGSAVSAGHSPYVFSRTGSGWAMTAASTEPETGVGELYPQVFNSTLTRFGFEREFFTSEKFGESPTVEYEVGPAGGPYTTAATVPRAERGGKSDGWVAASADFSKLVLQVEDRHLVEPASRTKTGFDLYEYGGGALRQANVQSGGAPIGSCGATIVPDRGTGDSGASSPQAVSADGMRVFFEAVPGSECGAQRHLYMRVDGERTADIGAVTFLAANEAGTKVLVEKGGGGEHEVALYDTETASLTRWFTVPAPVTSGQLAVTGDLKGLYYLEPEQGSATTGRLYRYDARAGTFSMLFEATGLETLEAPGEGRYLYFTAYGIPGLAADEAPSLDREFRRQVYRYDAGEAAVECVSCASGFDPEPRLGSNLRDRKVLTQANSPLPNEAGTANGDYVFFSTPAALVPSDIDGEVVPDPENGAEFSSGEVSPSSDVYEWRRPGLDGCSDVQGCLSLITNGRGGYLNLLIGEAGEGRDVFFYTSSQLVSGDKDTSGDIYDARVGGGFPPEPAGPTECEGALCSTPASPPNDFTPASATFTGAGDLTSQPEKPVVKKPPVKAKNKHKRLKKKRGRKRTRTKRQAGRRK